MDLTRINVAGLSFAQQRVVEIVAADGFLIAYGDGQHATASGKTVPYATVRTLLRKVYLRPNDDVLPGIDGTPPQTLLSGRRLTAAGLKQPNKAEAPTGHG